MDDAPTVTDGVVQNLTLRIELYKPDEETYKCDDFELFLEQGISPYEESYPNYYSYSDKIDLGFQIKFDFDSDRGDKCCYEVDRKGFNDMIFENTKFEYKAYNNELKVKEVKLQINNKRDPSMEPE